MSKFIGEVIGIFIGAVVIGGGVYVGMHLMSMLF